MPQLSNKVAIVTGASRGLGRAIAVKLAEDGAAIMLTGRDETLLKDAQSRISAHGGKAAWIALDLRHPEAAETLVKKTIETLGGIDIIVNNAGATKRGNFTDLGEQDWQDGFALKFFGAVRLLRAAWPMLKERKGSVVNISGSGGRTPGSQFTIGGSVNAAMLSLTKALADQGIADGIQVNAINPGAVRTARLTTRLATLAKERGIKESEAEALMVSESAIVKIGEPEDVANLVAFIVAPQNRYLHGALIDLDGGTTKTI